MDPANPRQQYGGFGPNSELRMPEWIYPMETLPNDDVIPGSLSDYQLIQSTNLGYSVNYKVYTPYNYTNQNNLSVIYVTDGHEYADDKLGSMVIVLNNLIYQQEIKPVIAVFNDPQDPGTGENRRGDKYRLLWAKTK